MNPSKANIPPEALQWIPTPQDVERYLNSMRTAPYRAINPASYGNAVRQRDQMPAPPAGKNSPFNAPQSLAPYSANSILNNRDHLFTASIPRFNIGDSTGLWFPMGPYHRLPDSGENDQGQLPVAGRVSGIGYANDGSGIFYIATASGGVWKWDPNNVDNVPIAVPGLDDTWTHYSDSQFPTLETSCVAVDPTDHKVVYVGMGDYDGTGPTANLQGNTQTVQYGPDPTLQPHTFGYGSGYGLGIMKTVNGGATWYNIGNGNPLVTPPGFGLPAGASAPIMEGTAVSGIVVDPLNSEHVLASSGRGVNPGGLWYSNDRGNTWAEASLSTGGTMAGNWSSIDVSNVYPTAPYTVANNSGPFTYEKFYATREYDGVYSSPNGVTWTKLPVPLIYNGTGLGGVLGLKVICSKLTIPTSLTLAPTMQRIVYVVDASQSNRDGRVFKSVDGGQTWVDITGFYLSATGQGAFGNLGNSWAFASFALSGTSALVPVQGNGSESNPLKNLLIDQLTIGAKFAASTTGAIEPTGPTGPLYIATQNDGPVTEATDPGASPDFQITAQENNGSWVPNVNFHGYAQDPSSLLAWQNGLQTFTDGMYVTDGGIYPSQTFQGFYQLDTTLNLLFYSAPTIQLEEPLSTQTTMNDQLVVAQMLGGDFFENGVNISFRGASVNTSLAATDDAETPFTQGLSYPSTYDYQPDWASITSLTNPNDLADPSWCLVTYAINQSVETQSDSDGDFFTVSTNPDGISDGFAPPVGLDTSPTMDNISFNPFDLTGATQAMDTSAGSGAWTDIPPAKRVYFTNANWQLDPSVTGTGSLDITPDQQEFIGKDGALIYLYNTTDPQDGVTGPNWRGEYHPNFGMPLAWGLAPVTTQNLPQWEDVGGTVTEVFFNTQVEGPTGLERTPALFTGGAFLWRFDPPGSEAYPPQPGPQPPQPTKPPFPVAPSSTIFWPFTVGPNQDRGIWRRVGTTQLADGTDADHISAIAFDNNPNSPSNTIYVGTTGGKIWVCTDDVGRLGADWEGQQPYQANNLPALQPTWYQIAGPGVTNSTLPTRPITSIAINEDPNVESYGDILVTLGGAPLAGTTSSGAAIVGRIYRCTDAVGALPNPPVFVNTSGTVSGNPIVQLPDVPIYSVARDLDDPEDIYYVATDLGVFATVDSGSTWVNATAPLGLPNVACTSIKVLEDTNTLNKTLVTGTFGRGVWGFDLTNTTTTTANPNLVFTSTYNRTGTQLIVNVKITNQAPALGGSYGAAYNVTINSAVLDNSGKTQIGAAYTNTSNPTGSLVSSSSPINVGTIGLNETAYVTLYFDVATVPSGTLADLILGGGYTLPPIPPGTAQTFSSTSPLTHLP